MILKKSFFKTTLLLTFLFCLASMVIHPLIPQAHALFWEDNSPSNDPNEVKQRPDHFSLFDWVGDAEKNAQKGEYRKLDHPDKGPGVNGGPRTSIIILTGVIGTGAGLFCAYEFTPLNTDMTAPYIIDGALGMCAGVIVGVLIMPKDYDVDPYVRNDYFKERQAFVEEPIRLQVQKAFHPTVTAFSLNF
jgi:hypothetical protein